MNVMHGTYWGMIALLFAALTACSSHNSKDIPDVSEYQVEWQLIRFEKELLSLDTTEGLVNTTPLFERFPVMSKLYFRDILGLRAPDDSLENAASELLIEPAFRHWLDTCFQVFGTMEQETEQFDLSFRLLKHYFPEREPPRVYTLVSEFSIGNFIFEDMDGRDGLGVGLDFFLGPGFPYTVMAKEFPAFSHYLSRCFTPEHLVRKTMAVIVEDMRPAFPPTKLLDAMLEEGIKMYVLEKLVPFVPDSILWEVTGEQMDWMKANEGAMWRHFIQEELLYSTDRTLIQKLTQASPNSPGMPLEAPGRTAAYTGYRIVAAYHRRHPEMTLSDILALTDAQQVLNASRYKPR